MERQKIDSRRTGGGTIDWTFLQTLIARMLLGDLYLCRAQHGADESISSVMLTMRENEVSHLSVEGCDQMIGIVTDRDIREFMPLKATTDDFYELHYLLEKGRSGKWPMFSENTGLSF